MSALRSTGAFLPAVLELNGELGAQRVPEVLEHGLLTRELLRNDHVMKMYRWQELEALLKRHPCTIEVASASNFLGRQETVQELVEDEAGWRALLDWELRCCREKGALDRGTHILSVVLKSSTVG
jgi:hypothetical protein